MLKRLPKFILVFVLIFSWIFGYPPVYENLWWARIFNFPPKIQEAQAAIAFDAGSESHTGTAGSASEASFLWTHTPVGTPKGALVFVFTNANADYITSVTYGGTTMTRVSGGQAIDTTGEAGRTDTFFLGSSVPTGAQTVTVTRTNNTTVMYATAITVTAAGNTTPVGFVLLQNDGTLAEQSVNDGSPGSNSVRFAGINSGLSTIGTAAAANTSIPGANSTRVVSIDFGARVVDVVRETTAGQGSRPVGFSAATSDDRAAVHVAVTDIGNATLTGTVTASITEADIVAGGKTIILTLDAGNWVAAGATFDAQRQNIINGIDSAQAESTGWDAVVKAGQTVGGVVRTSSTVVTITLDAFVSYNITATETITATIPGTALVGGNAIVATPTFAITSVNAAPNAPSQDSPANAATGVSVTPTFLMTATDPETNNLGYKVTIYSNSACTTVVQTNDQAVSATGWTGSNATCTASPTACYTSGTQGSFLTQTALSASTQYWWKASAKDPDGNGTFTDSSTCNTFTTGAAQSLTFSISDNAIGFGTLSASAARFANGAGTGDTVEVEAHTLIASTNATNGYIITVNGSTLSCSACGGATITAIGSTNTASSPGTEQFGLRMTATGGNGAVSVPYAAAGFALDTAAFPDQIASDPDGDDISTTYSVRYIANIATPTEAGSYSSTLTYIATGNF